MIFDRKITDDCQYKSLDRPAVNGGKLPHVDGSLTTLKPIIANPSKGGDAKPWI
jgi:hypothetical protein